jgi:hypothetical protein
MSQGQRDGGGGRPQHTRHQEGGAGQVRTSMQNLALRGRHEFQLRLSEVRRSERRRRGLQESPRVVVSWRGGAQEGV